jgi:hypothetical protein
MARRFIGPRLAVALAAATILISLSAGSVLADPPGMLVNPPNHRHFIETPNGLVPVGPQICGNPEMQQAFNQFHYNIHHSQFPSPGGTVIVPTLGPQDGAPGLHNGQGGELIGIGGCG